MKLFTPLRILLALWVPSLLATALPSRDSVDQLERDITGDDIRAALYARQRDIVRLDGFWTLGRNLSDAVAIRDDLWVMKFEEAHLYWSSTAGTYFVGGHMLRGLHEVNDWSDVWDATGFPVAEETTELDKKGKEVRYQETEKGRCYFDDSKPAALCIYGELYAGFVDLGGAAEIGVPTTRQKCSMPTLELCWCYLDDDVEARLYQHRIAGSHVVREPILSHVSELGFPYPLTQETPTPPWWNESSHYQVFHDQWHVKTERNEAAIFAKSDAQEAMVVRREFWEQYKYLGGVEGPLGRPLKRDESLDFWPNDGHMWTAGKYQLFEGGQMVFGNKRNPSLPHYRLGPLPDRLTWTYQLRAMGPIGDILVEAQPDGHFVINSTFEIEPVGTSPFTFGCMIEDGNSDLVMFGHQFQSTELMQHNGILTWSMEKELELRDHLMLLLMTKPMSCDSGWDTTIEDLWNRMEPDVHRWIWRLRRD